VREDIAKLVDPLFDRVEALDGDREIAHGVTVTHTGGHSPGHQQIEVALDSGLAIITGDNAYLLDAVDDGVPPGYVTSIPETMRAIADIRRRATHVLTMHDPRILERHAHGLR
jgi:glyoxylase-like metal-dependent hydrolase (beta-lactamase superfamily II)